MVLGGGGGVLVSEVPLYSEIRDCHWRDTQRHHCPQRDNAAPRKVALQLEVMQFGRVGGNKGLDRETSAPQLDVGCSPFHRIGTYHREKQHSDQGTVNMTLQ